MIAIIPARSGSKGLPDKNVKNLFGKPMIAYTVEAAVKSSLISDVIISTDSQKIADIATSYGATCPFLRPEYLASDNAKAVDNYIYTIERLNSEYGYFIKEFVVLQPTSPLRITVDIDSSISLFREKQAESVVSYTEESHPVRWHKYLDKSNKFENVFEDNHKLENRQDERKSYYPNGAIFVFDFNLIKKKRYYSEKSYAYLMPKIRSVDVDYIDDFEYAEYLLGKKHANK